MKPFVNSGHAFICFDSVSSLNIILKHFRTTPLQNIKIFFLSVMEQCKHFSRWCTGRDSVRDHQPFDQRRRSQSNFLRQSENLDHGDVDYERATHILIAHKASEPLDILWRNMGLIRSHFAFTRFFLFILGIVLIIFLSSPAVMINELAKYESFSWLKFGWTSEMGFWGRLIQKSGPPLLILLINTLVITLLDYASQIENYEAHSLYQNTVYLKTVTYTSLNMFIIPVLTSTGGMSIAELFSTNNFNVAKLLSELFIPKSGEFFALLLVQQGALSAVFYGLMISEILFSYFKPYYAFERRKMYNDQQPWRRDETLTFTYGYFNSQIMTIFMICIFYAPTVPLVPMAALCFVKIRHYVDGYNLLTYYRREIDTSG
jgi:hypothetical protein